MMKHMKLNPEEGRDIWVSSDFHFNHKNIVYGCSDWKDKSICRWYKSLEEHNQDLVRRINEYVKWNDILLFLGDWSFGGLEQIKRFRDQIHCETIHLILGNHDHHIERNEQGIQAPFTSVSDRLHLSYGKYDFILDHYPLESWMGIFKGWMHLFGHQHSDRVGSGRKMDVGIDKSGEMVYPYSIESIIDKLSNVSITGGVGDSTLEVNKNK